MPDRQQFDDLLLKNLQEKFHTDDILKVIELIGKEIDYREHRFDIVGMILYNIYFEVIKGIYGEQENLLTDLITNEIAVSMSIILSGGNLDEFEDSIRDHHREHFEQQIHVVEEMVKVDFPNGDEGIDDPIALRVRDKNLTVLRDIMARMDDKDVLDDPHYITACKMLNELDQTAITATTFNVFAHLIYLVNVYNIILSDEEAASIQIGYDDFKMLDSLSDESLEFLDNLD